jgi:hypothetical protein
MTSPKRYLRTIASFLVLLLLAPEALEAAKRKRPVSRKAITGKTVRSGKARARRLAPKRRPKPRPIQVETPPRVEPESRAEPAPAISVPVEPVPAASVAFRPAVFTAPVPVADWDYGTPKLAPKPEVQYPILRAVDRPHFEPLVLLAQGATPAPGAAPRPIDPPKQTAPPAAARQKYAPVPLALGLIGGGQLRDLLKTTLGPVNSLEDTSGRVIVGPTIQFHWDRYAVQLDALYRGYGLRSSGNLLGLGFSNRSTGRTWEFPLLLKRKFNSPEMAFRPFIGAGIAMRYLGQTSTLSANDQSASEQTTTKQLTFGLPLTAGMEFHLNRFRLSPELRYTLWTADNATPIRTQLFDPNYNQFQLLFGFTF